MGVGCRRGWRDAVRDDVKGRGHGRTPYFTRIGGKCPKWGRQTFFSYI
jgi:hypothetical protein